MDLGCLTQLWVISSVFWFSVLLLTAYFTSRLYLYMLFTLSCYHSTFHGLSWLFDRGVVLCSTCHLIHLSSPDSVSPLCVWQHMCICLMRALLMMHLTPALLSFNAYHLVCLNWMWTVKESLISTFVGGERWGIVSLWNSTIFLLFLIMKRAIFSRSFAAASSAWLKRREDLPGGFGTR